MCLRGAGGEGSEVIKEQKWGGHNDDFYLFGGGVIFTTRTFTHTQKITDPPPPASNK